MKTQMVMIWRINYLHCANCQIDCFYYTLAGDGLVMTEWHSERQAVLAMIEEKAYSLLNRAERHVLSRCCHSYGIGESNVDHLVDILLRLLSTPDKVRLPTVDGPCLHFTSISLLACICKNSFFFLQAKT